MTCGNCGAEVVRVTTVCFKGQMIEFCSLCPDVVPVTDVGNGNGKKVVGHVEKPAQRKWRSRTRRKFEKYELPKEVIKQTQAVRPKVRFQETETSKMLTDSVAFKKKVRAASYCIRAPGETADPTMLVMKDLTKKLGTSNFRIVYANDYKVVGERLDAPVGVSNANQ